MLLFITPRKNPVENSSATDSCSESRQLCRRQWRGQAMMTYRVMVRYVTTISVLGLAILGHVLT